MAGTPQFKIYRGGEYVAACKYAEDAAAMVGVSGTGVVKVDHRIVVWTEGKEEFAAGDSYDRAADVMTQRLRDHNRAAYIKVHGKLPDGMS